MVHLKTVAALQDADRAVEAAGSGGELRGKRHGQLAQQRESQRRLGQDDA